MYALSCNVSRLQEVKGDVSRLVAMIMISCLNMQDLGLVFPENTLAKVEGADNTELAQSPHTVFYTTDAIYHFYHNCKKKYKDIRPSLKDDCPHHSSGREYTTEEREKMEQIDKAHWHLWSAMFVHHGDDPALNGKGFCSRTHSKKVQAKEAQKVRHADLFM